MQSMHMLLHYFSCSYKWYHSDTVLMWPCKTHYMPEGSGFPNLLRANGIGVPQVALVAPGCAVPSDATEAAAAAHLGLARLAASPRRGRGHRILARCLLAVSNAGGGVAQDVQFGRNCCSTISLMGRWSPVVVAVIIVIVQLTAAACRQLLACTA